MKRIFILFIITSLCICKANNSTAQVNVNDSLALVDLYNSTDGAHWTNHSGWLQGPVSIWFGVTVSSGRVVQIVLHDNNLTGTLRSSFGDLTELFGISFSSNHLTGRLPSSFSNLTKLESIFLYNNQFSGVIPSFEKNNANFLDIELDYNQFTGALPNFLHIERVSELILDHNKLTGNIPEAYGNFSYQANISFSYNQLSGVIPASLANLQTFNTFQIQNNHFNFDSLEYIIANSSNYYYIIYSPQLNIPITYTAQGAYGKLSVHVGGTLSNNTYLWYKNNSLYKTISGDSAFIVDSPGVYFVKVNNAVVTALQLMSDSITIAAACSSPPTNTATTGITQTTARLNWNAAQGAVKYQIKFGATGGAVSTINTSNPYYKLSGLAPNTNYTWKVRSRCSLQYSAFSAVNNFTTLPALAAVSQSIDETEKENRFMLYPNPALTNVKLMFNSSGQSAYSITVYDIAGKMLLSKTGSANAGTNNFTLDIHTLTPGTYLVKIQRGADKIIMQKLVKE